MSAACARAIKMQEENPSDDGPVELADLFCRQAHGRIEDDFRRLFKNSDRFAYKVAQNTLASKYSWLENDIVIP